MFSGKASGQDVIAVEMLSDKEKIILLKILKNILKTGKYLKIF